MSKGFYGEDLHINLLRGCLDDGACPLWGNGCWAQGMATRLAGRADYPEDEPFRPHVVDDERWDAAWERLNLARRGLVVAANFMGDVACQSRGELQAFAGACWDDLRHTFLWLTKRPALLREKLGSVRLSQNVWLGASVWDQASADRIIPELLAVPAAHHWLSIEPMWGPLDLAPHVWRTGPIGADGRRPTVLRWVVVGCQSGTGARKHWGHPQVLQGDGTRHNDYEVVYWTRSIVDQCGHAGVPCFVKQLPLSGEVVKDVAAFPTDLRRQERPWRVTPPAGERGQKS